MQHTISHSALRKMGPDSVTHNLNGLIQSIAILNKKEKYNIVSDSTCIGMGKLGIGRIV